MLADISHNSNESSCTLCVLDQLLYMDLGRLACIKLAYVDCISSRSGTLELLFAPLCI